MRAQPCFVFVGEQFDNVPEFRLAKSLLLDVFRGRVVDGINLKVRNTVPAELCLKPFMEYLLSAFCMLWSQTLLQNPSVVLLCWQGITNAIFVTALDKAILLRQYAISLKKSGTRVRLPLGSASGFHG